MKATRKKVLLSMLAHKTRILIMRALIISALWPATRSGFRNARRELASLQNEGLLTFVTAKIRRVDQVALLHAGNPNDALPDFDVLADQLHSNWAALQPRPTRLMMATPKLNRLLGGVSPAKIGNTDSLAHDAGLGTLLLYFRKSAPALYAAFVTEDALPVRPFSVNPDGYLASRKGPVAIVEFCGSSYGRDRLLQIVQFARTERLSWQLWTPAPEEKP